MSAVGGDWRAKLRGSGYRLTPQRELILRAVDELGHATPDEVLARVREQSSAVNVSTVYRTLEVLEELGLVRHAHLSDRAPTYHSVAGPRALPPGLPELSPRHVGCTRGDRPAG